MTGFSLFTKFEAKDGITPTFKSMVQSAGDFKTKTSLAVKTLKSDFQNLKNSVLSVNTGLTAMAVVLPYKTFSQWHKGIASVNTLMSKPEIAQYGTKLENASKSAVKMGFEIDDANKGLFDTVSALGASDKSISVYTNSMKLAKGGCAELSVAIDGMTSVINAYGREITDSNRVANSFFTAQKYGKTTVAELSSNIGKVAPIAKAAGVGYEELMSTMAALTLGGLSTDEATTALRGALSALIKPSKDASDALKLMGIPYGVTQLRAKGLSYTLRKLNEAQKKNPDLMARAIPNIRAYTAAMALSEDKLQMIDTTLGAINSDIKNGTGLNEALETMSSSPAAAWTKAMGSLKVAAIDFGASITPVITPLINAISTLAGYLSSLSPKTREYIGVMIIFAGVCVPAINAVKVALGALQVATLTYGAVSAGVIEAVSIAWWAGGGTISGALKAIGKNMLWTAKTGMTAMLRGMWAFLQCPVTWVAIAIAAAILAIGFAFIYAYNHCEGFRKIVDGVVKGIFAAFNWLADALWGIIQGLMDAWSDFWNWLTNKSENVKVGPTPQEQEVTKNLYGDDMNSFLPLSGGVLGNKGGKGSLDININNNTPYEASVSHSGKQDYNMRLQGAFAQ